MIKLKNNKYYVYKILSLPTRSIYKNICRSYPFIRRSLFDLSASPTPINVELMNQWKATQPTGLTKTRSSVTFLMRLNRPVDFLVSPHLCGDRLNDLCRIRNESSKWSYQRMIALLSRFLTPLLVLGIGICWIALTRSGLVLTPPLAPEPIAPFLD